VIGLCDWGFRAAVRGRLPMGAVAALAAEGGFDGLDTMLGTRGGPAPDGTSAAPDRLSVTVPPLARNGLVQPDAGRRANAVAAIAESIGRAARLGAADISLSPGAAPPGADDAAADDAFAEAADTLLAEARSAGIVVVFENLPGSRFATLSRVAAAADRLPGLRLCLDVGNCLADGARPEAWLDALGGRIAKIHLSDGRMRDGVFEPADPGEGEVDWPGVRRLLDALPAGVPIFCEPAPAGIPAGAEAPAAARLRARLRELAGR